MIVALVDVAFEVGEVLCEIIVIVDLKCILHC